MWNEKPTTCRRNGSLLKMTVKKGLKALAESSPNFSNQGLENAINDIKSVDKDDGYSWIKSSIDVDTAIEDNTVLTASQKNDLNRFLSSPIGPQCLQSTGNMFWQYSYTSAAIWS